MEPGEFAERMREIATLSKSIYDDPYNNEETSHAAADRLMADALRGLGYGDGIDIFDSMTRWYS